MYPKVLCARCCGLGAGWAPWHVIAQSGPGDYAYMWGAGTRGWWETCRGAWWPAGQCRGAVCWGSAGAGGVVDWGQAWGHWEGRDREGNAGTRYTSLTGVGGDRSMKRTSHENLFHITKTSLRARSMGPTWGPFGAARTQVGPMLATWNLLSGNWLGKFTV